MSAVPPTAARPQVPSRLPTTPSVVITNPFAQLFAKHVKPQMLPKLSTHAVPAGAGTTPKRPQEPVTGDAHGKPATKLTDQGDEAKLPKRADATDPLDPETRRYAQLAPPSFGQVATPAPVAPSDDIAPRARVSMEELLPQLVKRIAWAGDRRRGSVQMELGAGPHAGTVVTVHSDEGRVRVELQGDDTGALRRRLEAKGFAVDR